MPAPCRRPSCCCRRIPGTTTVWSDVGAHADADGVAGGEGQEMHLCPLQFDIVERAIAQLSNKGDTVFDPFGGLKDGALLRGEARPPRLRGGAETRLFPRRRSGALPAMEESRAVPSLFDYAGLRQAQAEGGEASAMAEAGSDAARRRHAAIMAGIRATINERAEAPPPKLPKFDWRTFGRAVARGARTSATSPRMRLARVDRITPTDHFARRQRRQRRGREGDRDLRRARFQGSGRSTGRRRGHEGNQHLAPRLT